MLTFLFPQLHLPLNSPLAGSELTKEPFRWDQRLFALVLRLPGAATPDTEQLGSVPTDDSAITQMCEVTGGLHPLTAAFSAMELSRSPFLLAYKRFISPPPSGRSYCVRTQRMLNQCLESLVQKVQSGVVLDFEKTGPDPPPVGDGESQLWKKKKLLFLCSSCIFCAAVCGRKCVFIMFSQLVAQKYCW